jgi:putative GTP pyrophosphokinase
VLVLRVNNYNVWASPPQNKSGGEDFDNLLVELQEFKISTPKQLKEFISKWHDKALENDADVVKARLADPDSPRFEGERERLEIGVFFTHAGLTREALSLEFGKQYRDFQGEFYRRLIKGRGAQR